MEYTKEQILAMLQSSEPEDQREGAFEARDRGLKEAVPLLIPLLQSENVGVQEAADLALRKLGGEETVKELIPLLKEENPALRNLAMDILRDLAGQGIKHLVPLLKDEDRDIRIFVADILGWSESYLALEPLCESLLKDRDVNVRYQAAVSLGLIGHPESVECLSKALDDEEWVQFAVIEALVKIRDENTVETLINRLDSSSELVASMIIEGIGSLGFTKAVPLLAKKIFQVPFALQLKILKALYQLLGRTSFQLFLEKDKEKYLELLLLALEDEEEEVRELAIIGLAKIGDARATAKLLDLAEELDLEHQVDTVHNEDLAHLFVDALVHIGINEELLKGLEVDSPSRNLVAIRTLKGIGSIEAGERLKEVFWHKDRDLQREIARALEEMALIESREFFLEVLEKHKDGDVLKSALIYLGRIRDKNAIEVLFPFLDHQWDDVKETALESLIKIGGDEVLERFARFFEDGNSLHRLMAVYAFGQLKASAYQDLVKTALEDEDVNIRKIALESMAKMCSNHKEALPVVAAKLEDEAPEVRMTLVELMGNCEHDEVLPYLLKALDDSDDWVKIRAIEALVKKGKVTLEITKKLTALIEYSNKIVAVKAIEALGKLQSEEGFHALLEALEIPDFEIQEAVEKALDQYQQQYEVK